MSADEVKIELVSPGEAATADAEEVNEQFDNTMKALTGDEEVDEEVEVTSMRAIIGYMIFLIAFLLSMYFSHGDHEGYYLLQGMDNEIVQREFSYDEGERGFMDISDIADLYRWINYPLLPVVLGEEYVSGEKMPENRQHTPNFYNKLIGGIRIRQVRSGEKKCEDIPANFESVNFTCWSDDNLQNQVDPRYADNYEKANRYKYMTSDETEDVPWSGYLDLYPADGFVIDLPKDMTKAKELVDHMKADNWIDAGAKIVMIRFWTYNPRLNMAYTALFTLEMPSGGGIVTKVEQQVTSLNKYASTIGYGQLVPEIIVLISVCFFIYQEASELYKTGFKTYIKDMWNIADWLSIIFLITVIGFRGAVVKLVSDGLGVGTGDHYVEISRIVLMIKSEDYIASLVSFLLLVKLMKILGERFPRVNVFGRMFSHAVVDLLLFVLLFCLFLFSFAFAGYIAFSSSNRQFRSLAVSFRTLLRGCFGDMDYTSLEISNRLFGPLFYFLFNMFIVLVTVNVFIAIMSESWEVIRSEEQKYSLQDFIATLLKGEKSKAVDVDEFFEALQKVDPSISRARAKKIFDTVDVDKSGTIDSNEMKNVKSHLSSNNMHLDESHHLAKIKGFLEPQDMQVHHFREDITTRLETFDKQMVELLTNVTEETKMLKDYAQKESKSAEAERDAAFQKIVEGQMAESDQKIEDLGTMFSAQFKDLQSILQTRRSKTPLVASDK